MVGSQRTRIEDARGKDAVSDDAFNMIMRVSLGAFFALWGLWLIGGMMR